MKVRRIKREVPAVVGIDQSANGTAAVALAAGRLERFLFFADTKKAFRELGRERNRVVGFTVVEPVVVKGDDEVAKTVRLRRIREELRRFVAGVSPTHVAFEGYSMTRAPVASRVLGEVGGILRVLLADLGVPFRVYPVEAVKTFATGKASAEKADMVLACRDRWDEPNWLKYGKTEGAAGNLADAYVIAQLLYLELEVRAGRVVLEDLDADARAVLQRVTPKRQPVAILETPFAEVPR
jgi:Holliday junction resolvasome RuvABC endonuclease subunit